MINSFINYLNSINNANSNTINAIAESQVTNKYYNHIRVDRRLGDYIYESINNKQNRAFIITGHAGDGKTSLLIQVLNRFGVLNNGERLEIASTVRRNDVEFFYVKDMSELDKSTQIRYLKQVLEAPKLDKSAILVANTGPLINAFKELFSNIDSNVIESILLNQLDTNEEEQLEINGYMFNLINVARIDNVCFVKDIIENILNENLWTQCVECGKKEICSIYCNYCCIQNNKECVIAFLDSFYRWLFENDKRMTIRQILSQISFAITGNLSCEDINKWKPTKHGKFIYNFANLFFGYKGIVDFENMVQIKGVEYIRQLEIDSRALSHDYKLFVNNDFSIFPSEIREVVNETWNRYMKKYLSSDIRLANDVDNVSDRLIEDANMRKSIRRFVLMYSMSEEPAQLEDLFSQVYSEVFPLYKKAISEKLSNISKRPIKNLVYDALYISYLGIPPKSRDNLYITLRREDTSFQNVFLLLGEMKFTQFDIIQKLSTSVYDDEKERYKLYMALNGMDEFELSLPLLTYFKSIVNGAIDTNLNPALTHGIAKLNAKLFNIFKYKDIDSGSMRLLVNTYQEPLVVECNVSGERLYIE